MGTTYSTNRKFKRMFVNILSIVVMLAMAFPAITAVAASNSPFIGHWEATDVDGSGMTLNIAGRPTGPFQITWTDDYISFCDGEAGIVRGTGWLNESDSNLLEADVHLECFTTGATLDFHVTFRYHTATNALSLKYSSGQVTIWHRPGGGQVQEPPLLGLRVNYGHDWVESFYEGGHTAWITVTESDGVTVKATAELMTELKDYWGGETGFQSLDSVWFDGGGNQMENPPDILPNDWVYGWVDNGASAQVQIGDISGMIDLANDSIGGTIYAPWFSNAVQVECLDWGSGQEPPFDYQDGGLKLTNGEDPYSCSWEGWDIQPGQDVGVAYTGPDGHWVVNAFRVPKMDLRVNYGHDWVESFYEAGHVVEIVVTESDGVTVKATAELLTESKDFWGGESGFQTQTATEPWSPAPPDIQPYDWVYAQVDNGASAQVQIGDISGTIDFELNAIEGTVSASWYSEEVGIECHSWGAPLPYEILKYDTVQPNNVDTYSCAWDPQDEWDIQPGEDVGVAYFGPDGHWVANAFYEPATFIVNNTDDMQGDDGACTLREAIIAANTNSPSGEMEGECPAGLDFAADTILLAADQTYSLTIDSTNEDGATDGDLDIWDNSSATDLIIMVEGNGSATISQDATVDDRVLDILGAMVEVNGLTFAGGSNVDLGGGVQNTDGTLIMSNSAISSNMANRGGGLFNNESGTLNLINSLVSGNSANIDGGGIWNFGTLVVDASKISLNSATYGGGGLFNYVGTATIQNSSSIGGDWSDDTNLANYGGGIAIWSGTVNLKNSTVSGNKVSWDGGGILNGEEGTLNIEASSFGGNTAEHAGGVILNAGVLTIDSSQIATNFAQFGGGLYNTDTGQAELVGTEISDNSAPSNGGGIENHGTLIISSSNVSWNFTHGSGGGLLNFGNVTIQSASEINDNYAGWAGGGIFNVNIGTLTVDASSIFNNTAAVFGGGIMNEGMSTVNNSEVSANSTPVKGGGISNSGTLIVDNSILSGNSAGEQGGALYNYGTATIQNNTLVGGASAEETNIAEGGGGLFSLGTLTVNDSIVTGNRANYGGGLFNWIGGILTISNSTVSNNSANEGGGLHNKEGSTAIIQNGSVFSGNYAEWGGGGIDNWGTITITGSVLRENTSPGEGDALANGGPEGSTATVTGSCMVGNGDTAVFNVWSVSQNFTGNWWGDASGPSGIGVGTGDSVSDFIDFSDWLTVAPDVCGP